MKLVIVESPNKVRKIKDFLGSGYRVAASFGHVRDLPAAGGLSVEFKDGKITPTYEMLERSSWHVSRLLGERKYSRVVFHAVTKAEVQKAMSAPRALDQRLVDAQQARRVL